jgi:rhodanese-related sulfurtransferase
MFNFLKNLFGLGSKVDFKALIEQGAVIVDVRTKSEFQSGHVKKSINIPLNELPSQLSKLKKEQTIITCCASGMRSASAKSILKQNGFTNVYNGGSWTNLK